jgi:hypothetical protein
MSKVGASITSLTRRPPSPNASSTAPSCCRRTRRAIPSPHPVAHRAKPRVPDQAATSSPAPSHVSHARPRKHAITGHQCVAAASRRPPRTCRCPGSLSIASLPVWSCPTAPSSRRVDPPSRIPPAELPEPPLTGKHELRVLDPGQDTAFPRL